MPSDENKIEKLYYSIGDVAAMLHVPASLLRFWQREFPNIIQPDKGSHGRRMYNNADIQAIRILYDLIKNQGYTLEGAKKHFRSEKKEYKDTDAVVKSLEKIRTELQELKNNYFKS